MARICTFPAGATEGLIRIRKIYSCPTHTKGEKRGRLKEKNTKADAPFYAFRTEGGVMNSAWQADFGGQALLIVPSTNLADIRKQAMAQRHHLSFSDSQFEDLCLYVSESLQVPANGEQDYAQEQYYHFLTPTLHQPNPDKLPQLAKNTTAMVYLDWTSFLAGGPQCPVR